MNVIQNPPYNGSLHLKILDNVIKTFLEAKIVNLSPIRWLEDPLAEYKKSTDFKRFENIRKHIENVEIIMAREANSVFNARISSDLGIYVVTKDGGWDSKSLWNTIAMKILNKTKSYKKEFDFNKKDGWRVRIAAVTAGPSCGSDQNRKKIISNQKLITFFNGMKDGKPWYDFYNKNQYSKTTPEITCSVKFNTETEAENFIKINTSKIGKYFYDKTIIDVNVNNNNFIWINDFTKKWTDEMLYEYFNLTEDEIKTIESEMK